MKNKLPLSLIAALLLIFTQPLLLMAAENDGDSSVIHSVVVLPVVPHITSTTSKSMAENLQTGALMLSETIQEHFKKNPAITVINQEQKDAETADFKGGRLELIQHLGMKFNTDAILEAKIDRYEERQGGNYSINVPASLSFEFKLFHIPSGRIICSGMYDETQKSLLEDIFSFSKAAGRGFKWISVKEMATEAVQKKFSECRYLQ